MSYLPDASAVVERFTRQVGSLYDDDEQAPPFGVKAFVLLANLKNTAPGVSFLIPHSSLCFQAKSLVALFAHIIRHKWADILGGKGFSIRLTPAADVHFIEFCEDDSYATWRFSLSRHFDLAPGTPLWWKLEYFAPLDGDFAVSVN